MRIRIFALLAGLTVFSTGHSAAEETGGKPVEMVVDHSSVALADRIPAAELDKARRLGVAMGHPPAGNHVSMSLARLATADPKRYAMRSSLSPNARWLANGGIGTYAVGDANGTSERIEGMIKRLDAHSADSAVAALQLSPQDIAPGRRVEISYIAYEVDMEIHVMSVGLEGVFTELIQAPRVIGAGDGGGVVTAPLPYPIELPNVSVKELHTRARVPAGFQPDDLHPKTTAYRPVVSARDPRLAFVAYRDGMERLAKAHPKTRVVWMTVPLTTSENLQRNNFNFYVRDYAKVTGKPLFDLADLLSHDAAGVLQEDRQGPMLAKAEAINGSIPGPAMQERLARAWWVLLARLSGWDGLHSEAQPD